MDRMGFLHTGYSHSCSPTDQEVPFHGRQFHRQSVLFYRQKNIAGNFENVGYAEQDKAGVYNILIMEERQTIIACGAGSTTKLVLPEKIRTSSGKETNLIRVENVKNITEYIDRIDEMIERKEALFEKD